MDSDEGLWERGARAGDTAPEGRARPRARHGRPHQPPKSRGETAESPVLAYLPVFGGRERQVKLNKNCGIQISICGLRTRFPFISVQRSAADPPRRSVAAPQPKDDPPGCLHAATDGSRAGRDRARTRPGHHQDDADRLILAEGPPSRPNRLRLAGVPPPPFGWSRARCARRQSGRRVCRGLRRRAPELVETECHGSSFSSQFPPPCETTHSGPWPS